MSLPLATEHFGTAKASAKSPYWRASHSLETQRFTGGISMAAPFSLPTLCGVAGSYTETYARSNGMTFKTAAVPVESTVMVDGSPVAFEAYNIGGYTYFKLRDLAMTLNGTGKQFNVIWYNAGKTIDIVPKMPYVPIGGELAVFRLTGNVTAVSTSFPVYLEDRQITPAAYTIGGSNNFKLRDVAAALNFGATWDAATNTISIETETGLSSEEHDTASTSIA